MRLILLLIAPLLLSLLANGLQFPSFLTNSNSYDPNHFSFWVSNQTPRHFDLPKTLILTGSKLIIFGRLVPNRRDIFSVAKGIENTSQGVLSIPVIGTENFINIAWSVGSSRPKIAASFGTALITETQVLSLLENPGASIEATEIFTQIYITDRLYLRIRMPSPLLSRCELVFSDQDMTRPRRFETLPYKEIQTKFSLMMSNQSPFNFDLPTTLMKTGSKVALFGRLNTGARDTFLAVSGTDWITNGLLKLPVLGDSQVVNIAWYVSSSQSRLAIKYGEEISTTQEIDNLLQDPKYVVLSDETIQYINIHQTLSAKIRLSTFMPGRCEIEFYSSKDLSLSENKGIFWIDIIGSELQLESTVSNSSSNPVVQLSSKSSTQRSKWYITATNLNTTTDLCYSIQNLDNGLYLTANGLAATLQNPKLSSASEILTQLWIFERSSFSSNRFFIRSCKSPAEASTYFGWDQLSPGKMLSTSNLRPDESGTIVLTRIRTAATTRSLNYIARPKGFLTSGRGKAALSDGWALPVNGSKSGAYLFWEKKIPSFQFEKQPNKDTYTITAHWRNYNEKTGGFNGDTTCLLSTNANYEASWSSRTISFPSKEIEKKNKKSYYRYYSDPNDSNYLKIYNPYWNVTREAGRNGVISYRICKPRPANGSLPLCLQQVGDYDIALKIYDEQQGDQLFNLTLEDRHPYFGRSDVKQYGLELRAQEKRIEEERKRAQNALLKFIIGIFIGEPDTPWWWRFLKLFVPLRVEVFLNMVAPSWECQLVNCHAEHNAVADGVLFGLDLIGAIEFTPGVKTATKTQYPSISVSVPDLTLMFAG